VEHGFRGQRQTCRENVPREGLRSDGGACIGMVGVRQVVEYGQIDAEDAKRQASTCKDGHNPRDCRIDGRTQPKEANGKEEALATSEEQPALGLIPSKEAGEARGGGIECMVLPDGRRCGDDRGDRNCKKDKASSLRGEAIRTSKHEGHSLKGKVENRPCEGHPESEPEDNALGAEKVDGAKEGCLDQHRQCGAVFVRLHLPAKPAETTRKGGMAILSCGQFQSVASRLLEALVPRIEDYGLAAQQHTPAGFGEGEEQSSDDSTTGDGLQVEDPPPGQMLCDHAGDCGTNPCAAEGSSGEDGHGRVAFLGDVDVAHHPSHNGAKHRAGNAGQRPCRQHARKGAGDA